jgi:hypothetical protein
MRSSMGATTQPDSAFLAGPALVLPSVGRTTKADFLALKIDTIRLRDTGKP